MSNTDTHIPPSSRTLPWFTAVTLVLGITVVAALYWKKQVRVGEITVRGNQFTLTEEITGQIDLNEDLHPDSVDLYALQKSIEDLDYIRSASLYIEPDGGLKVTVQERLPIGLLMKSSQRAYMDTDGVVLPVPDRQSVNLPIVYGFSTRTGDTLKTDAFTQVRDFLLAAQRQPLAWDTISEVAFDQQEGVVALSHENGVKLILGYNDFDQKVTHWNAFYRQVVRKKGISGMQQVDLRFDNQIVSREVNL